MILKNGFGRIVNVSSGYGAMSGMGGHVAAYRISKAALNALTIIMAHELRDCNIKVYSDTSLKSPSLRSQPLGLVLILIILHAVHPSFLNCMLRLSTGSSLP